MEITQTLETSLRREVRQDRGKKCGASEKKKSALLAFQDDFGSNPEGGSDKHARLAHVGIQSEQEGTGGEITEMDQCTLVKELLKMASPKVTRPETLPA